MSTLSLALLVSITAGCNPSVGLPTLFNPGPAGYQRQQAVQFDPFPDQDAGPKIEGGRPLDYNRQIPEVERSRFFSPGGVRNPTNWFGRRFGVPGPPVNAPQQGGGSKGGPRGIYYPGARRASPPNPSSPATFPNPPAYNSGPIVPGVPGPLSP